MASSMANTPAEKLALITKNLQEVLNPEIIQAVLEENQRPVKIYWGTATTGKPHCGYLVPTLKIAEFLAAGCEVTVLIADVHGFLDNLKAPIELVEQRSKYYTYVITALLKAIGVDISRLKFKTGSDHQTKNTGYFMDFLRLSTCVSSHDASRAGSEVVKQVKAPPVSAQIYPIMQSLDEEYLGVDAQFGGLDQRKIFTLASEILPRIGYKRRAHLMNPLIPGLQEGGKMSSSDPDSKIDLLDSEQVVTKKLKKAFCPPKQVEGNGVLAFVQYALLPASALKSPNGIPHFIVKRRDGEDLVYSDFRKMKDDYENDILQPQTLKPAVTEALQAILAPIREAFAEDKEWQEVERLAYPPPPEKVKKVKKAKEHGQRPVDKASKDRVAAKPDGSLEGEESRVKEANLGQVPREAVEKLTVAE
ncbi:tyrosine tRNA ligase [Piedraia hortae CBS 480.64]|uniref:Tyrosine--tRNA ligase n=1 Tax=Piedraia hortae CBS 480.64 TaxID=1314780 RepID=A0A6A7BXS9_9PEZI|nr:tyrosine tRNA ligase [Piedraia hortae CBS 480.64]